MKAIIHGNLSRPVVAVVGVWDPMLPGHRQLFQELMLYAANNSLAPLVIVLDPPPPCLMMGASNWPLFDDTRSRIELLQHHGFQGVMQVCFEEKKELALNASAFFDLVQAHVSLSELWLGANQPLGNRGTSGPREIRRLAQERNFRFHQLPETNLTGLGKQVRDSLVDGHLATAASLLGRPPLRSRPASGTMEIAWQPGAYRAIALDSLAHFDEDGQEKITLSLVQQANGQRLLHWPDATIPYLAFVAGPGDLN
ncbi:MAG TPA: hypothetical protein VH186_29635 [Chloroflexia bacterium]|nr:hypothetical protein [Chloroflexia bacterium]